MPTHIAILDFGSQYTQLIARRIRELNVYSKILSPSVSAEALFNESPSGIILSGGPHSVYERKIPFDEAILNGDVPILGVCYGMQLINSLLGGTLCSHAGGEYGKQNITICKDSPLLRNMNRDQTVWMSHGDSVDKLAPELMPIAVSNDGLIAAVQHKKKQLFGLQFHPEVTHSKNGMLMLDNFLKLCNCERNWSLQNYLEERKNEIREKVGSGKVVSLVSGGVDSTAATILCMEALGKENVYPLHIDNGLMREDESNQVEKLLRTHGMEHITHINASADFLTELQGIEEPEKKREIIGNLFIDIMDKEIKKLDSEGKPTYFCQGTLYTDLIESGKGCGDQAAVIKSHHNVNPPVVEEKRRRGLIIEPNSGIFKDEVRDLCRLLNLPEKLIQRHPFPGPGLAIRILGEVTPGRLKTLRLADQIYIDMIREAGLYNQIWQAFATLLPIKTVGVMGDKRTEGNVIALRAVTSVDGMTADFFNMPHDLLGQISTRIINEVPGVNRVVYDVTSKPPATIEWE